MSVDRAYRVTISFDPERERFLARVPELGVEVDGESRAAAVEAAEAAVDARVEAAATGGQALPAPLDAAPPAADLTLTLAPTVHRELLHAAQAARLSPEQLAAQLLSHALGQRGAPGRARPQVQGEEQGPAREQDDRRGPPRGQDPGRGGRRRQEGYRPDLDDKGHFLAYVRELEKGGGGRGGRGR
jgi:hypothetical protein